MSFSYPNQINFHYEKEITATDLTCTNKDLTHPLPNPIHPANPPHLENPTIWSSSKLPNNICLRTKFIDQLLLGDQAPLLLLRQKGCLHDLQNFSKLLEVTNRKLLKIWDFIFSWAKFNPFHNKSLLHWVKANNLLLLSLFLEATPNYFLLYKKSYIK